MTVNPATRTVGSLPVSAFAGIPLTALVGIRLEDTLATWAAKSPALVATIIAGLEAS